MHNLLCTRQILNSTVILISLSLDMDMDMEMDDDMGVPTPAAPSQQAAPASTTLVPIHTIYVRNLNYKMQPNEMRKALYAEFIKFGKILDIVVGIKRFALRGQAWIIFDDVNSAVRAVSEMNGKVVLNRPVVFVCSTGQDQTVSFARTESDLILKREGRFVYSKRTFQSYAEIHAREMAENEGRAAAVLDDSFRYCQARIHNNPPNNKLLLFDLPSTISKEVLLPILQPYSGFRDLGIVPGRGIAFVDFDTVRNAEVCLSAIKSAVLPSGERIYASYAK